MEFIDLHSIFKEYSVISSIQNYFNNSETPIICYKCNKPIRSSIFNFNKIVSEIYRFSSNIDFTKCRSEIAASLIDFSNRWCKRENVEPNGLKEWKINILKIIDTCISFFSRNTHLLSPKLKSSFRHLKRGIQDFFLYFI